MKTLHIFSFMLISIVAVACTSNTKNEDNVQETTTNKRSPRDILINTYWAFDFDGSYERMTKKRQRMIDELTVSEKNNVRASYENARVVFEDTGKMATLLEGGIKIEHSWKLSEDGKKMIAIEKKPKRVDTIINHIEILTPESFVSRFERNGKTQYLVLKKASKKKAE